MKAKRRVVTATGRPAAARTHADGPAAPGRRSSRRPPTRHRARPRARAAIVPATAADGPLAPDAPVDLAVDLGRGLVLPNPILVASGTFGYGVEYGDVVDVDRLGAICCKGTTLRPRIGNPTPRVTETPGGMLNSIGLQNPGVDAVIEKYAATWTGWQVPVIVNVAGESVEDYVEVARRLDGVPGRRRHRAQHLVPERRQGRPPVRDRCRGRRRGHGGRPAGHRPAAARQALAERRRHPADRAGHRRRRRRRAHGDQHAVGHRGGAGSRRSRSSATSTAGCRGRPSSPSRCGSSTRPSRP